VRDGLGGGFMERQERASKATVEVDEDGFDDFGRRAKKTKEDRRLKEEAALKRLQSSYGFLLPHDENSSTSVDIKDKVKDSSTIRHETRRNDRDHRTESRKESYGDRNSNEKDKYRGRDRDDSRNRRRNRSEEKRRDCSRSRSDSRRRHRR
jgi:hypothetical protein